MQQQNLFEAETNRLNTLGVNFKFYNSSRKDFVGIVVSKKYQTLENLARIKKAGYVDGGLYKSKENKVFWISISDLKEKLEGEFLE